MRAPRPTLPRGASLSAGLALLGAFLVGSIPVAWILVRLVTRTDLSRAGSANIGALNALRVSRSRALGVAVLVLDALKGAGAVWGAGALGAEPGLGLIGVVAGHNYNPWLSWAARRLVGGKGFAAVTGGLLCLMPWLVVVWFVALTLAWCLLFAGRGIRDEAPASAAATLACVPAAAWLYGGRAALIVAVVALLILPRLVRELRILFAPPP